MESFQLCAQRHIGKKFEILFKSHLMITHYFSYTNIYWWIKKKLVILYPTDEDDAINARSIKSLRKV